MSKITDNALEAMREYFDVGAIDKITLRNFESLCVPEVPAVFTPKDIAKIRKKLSLSQSAMAALFNISKTTIAQWEHGTRKPNAAAKKLLDVVNRKGIAALT